MVVWEIGNLITKIIIRWFGIIFVWATIFICALIQFDPFCGLNVIILKQQTNARGLKCCLAIFVYFSF